MGVVSAALKFANIDWYQTAWAQSDGAAICGIAAYVLLIGYFVFASMKAKK